MTEVQYVSAHATEFSEIAGFKVRVRPDVYSPTMVSILRAGKYEGEERLIVPRVLCQGDRVLELGSAIGLVTMVATKIVGPENIKCIDANPKMVEDAKVNFAENGFDIDVQNGVVVNRQSWGGKGSTMEFYIARDFWSSSLARGPHIVETLSVPCFCLEDEIGTFKANTIICDIEGGEATLFDRADLRGIEKIILEVHPKKIDAAPLNRAIRAIIGQDFSIDLVNSWGGIMCFYRGLSPSWK